LDIYYDDIQSEIEEEEDPIGLWWRNAAAAAAAAVAAVATIAVTVQDNEQPAVNIRFGPKLLLKCSVRKTGPKYPTIRLDDGTNLRSH
jgi:hypothetical protein